MFVESRHDNCANNPQISWQLDPSVISVRIGDEVGLFHLRTGKSYTLPPLAAHVWHMLKRGYGQIEIASSFPRQYYGDVEKLVADVAAIFQMLEDEEIIQLGDESNTERRDEQFGDSDIARPLMPTTNLKRAASLTIHLEADASPTIILESEKGPIQMAGGNHALRLIDAFEQPCSVRGVIRALQGRVANVEEWSEIVMLLYELYHAGVLQEPEVIGIEA